MNIRTVSLIRREKIFSRGRTIIPCELCGMRVPDRLRLVVEDSNGKQKVIHVCMRSGCLTELADSEFDFSKAGKARRNGVGWIKCSFCELSAKGGIWLYKQDKLGLVSPNEEVPMHPQYTRFFPRYEVAICSTCIKARLKSLKEQWLANGGKWNR